MSSISPEQEQLATMLRSLHGRLMLLDPTEHRAHCHLDMSIDSDEAMATIGLAYKYDEQHIRDSFEELQKYFDEDYGVAKALLADEWNVDQHKVPWPQDESQHAASYFSSYKKEDFRVTVTRWTQPLPDDGAAPMPMIAACIEPMWSMTPTVRMIFVGDTPLVSCKFNALGVAASVRADWSETGELTPDDVMLAENVVKRIPFHTFDTSL